MNFGLPPVYPITDRRLSGLSHAEQVEQLAAGGATLIQLRDKDASPRDFYDQAVEAIRIARAKNVRIVINDRADIALCAGADGVHLGQDDLSPAAARGLLGPNALIGYSTHSLGQATAAEDLPIDYIAIGPVFGTSTKADSDPVVGLDGISAVRDAVGSLPLVAIGGINPEILSSVMAAGADSVAVISCLYSGPASVAENLKTLLAGLNN